MKLILFFFVLLLAFVVSFEFIADPTQDWIASHNDSDWAPMAQESFATLSYYLHQNRVTREANAMWVKLFPDEADKVSAYYRIAKASDRLSDYTVALKYYKKCLNEKPKGKLVKRIQGRMADIEGVYLEFVQ